MRREGKPHGMVRTYHMLPSSLNPRQPRPSQILTTPPTAGVFTKLPNKPTNHSKFTGKCDRPGCTACHIHAGSKSKNKSKGTHKVKSSDAMLNYKHISWSVNSDPPASIYDGRVSGFSASDILDRLVDDDHYYDEEDTSYISFMDDLHYDRLEIVDGDDKDQTGNDDDDKDDDGDGSDVSFYDVAVVWDPVDEDEGWSLVTGDYM